MKVKTWELSGLPEETEIAVQKAFFTGLCKLAGVLYPDDLFGTMDYISTVRGIVWSKGLEDDILLAIHGIIGSHYEAIEKVVLVAHFKYIAEHGYHAWFDYLTSVRDDQPYEIDFEKFSDGV